MGGGLSTETARRLGVLGAAAAAAAAAAAVDVVGSRDGGRDRLFRSCAAGGGALRAALGAAAPVVTAALFARACVGAAARLVAVEVVDVAVAEPADVGLSTMEFGRVADDSGGYLCVSFLAAGGGAAAAAAVCSGAVVADFFLSETDLVGAATEDAFDDALPGLCALPLVDRVGAVVVVVEELVGRSAGFVGSRLGETLRLGPWLCSRGRSLGGNAVGPVGLRSERARVRDAMTARGVRGDCVPKKEACLRWELGRSLLFAFALKGSALAPLCWSVTPPPIRKKGRQTEACEGRENGRNNDK